MYGAGTVVAFNKKLGFGASSHEIQFDRCVRQLPPMPELD